MRAFLLLLATGCVKPGPALKARPTYPLVACSRALGIVRKGWHTAIVLPASQLTGPLAPIRHMVPQAPFIGIGWGNRRYYRERHPSLLTGLRALFPSQSVLHVTAWSYRRLIDLSRTNHLYWIGIANYRWHRLRSFLVRSFTLGPHGSFVAVGPKTRHGDFFASHKTYDAWHTCNTWTAEALRTIGFREQVPVLFAGQVTDDLRQFKIPRHSPTTPSPTLTFPPACHFLRQP